MFKALGLMLFLKNAPSQEVEPDRFRDPELNAPVDFSESWRVRNTRYASRSAWDAFIGAIPSTSNGPKRRQE